MMIRSLFLSVITLIAISACFAQKPSIEDRLRGYWKSSEAIVEFRTGSRVTINGDAFDFAVVGSTLVLATDQDSVDIPFKLVGDTLTVVFEGRKITYTRMTEDEIAELGSKQVSTRPSSKNTGGVAQELVGKWCYAANVNAIGGGRQSDICFTLKADGTYEYYGETSNSNIYGGSNSQSWDYGRWSATATTLTAHSNSGKTTTYTLEKRNHPKNGDPMLMVDGDAFISYYQKRPW